jgi:hypothetical protein
MVGIRYRLSKFYATLPKFIQMSHQTSQSLKSIWFLRTNNRTKVHFHFITSFENKVLWKIKSSICGTDLLFSDNQISYFVLV